MSYSINYTNDTSLHNWVEQLDLVCVSNTNIGLLGSMYFAGWSCSLLFVPLLSDKFGRKRIFIAAVAATVLCMVGTMLSHSLVLTDVLIFLVGVLSSGRIMVGYVYGSEFCPPKWQIVFGSVYHLMDGALLLPIAIYYDFISKHYRWLPIIGITWGLICIVGVGLFGPESPLWELKMGNKARAEASIKRILAANGYQESDITAATENNAIE